MSTLVKSSKNNSRRVFRLPPPKKTWKMILWAVMLLIVCLITTSQWSTCPSSSSASNAITTEQCSFSGFTNTYTYKVALGPVSASLYYLYYISTPNRWVIRKVKPDGSLAWMAALLFNPLIKSLSVDALEQYVYAARFSSPLDVVRFGADTGAIVDAQT